jgi:hypothetical protein
MRIAWRQAGCFLGMTGLLLAGSPALAQCPGAGCAVPPPARAESTETVARRLEGHIAREKAILGSLAQGAGPAKCTAALESARKASRYDLVQDIERICKPASN